MIEQHERTKMLLGEDFLNILCKKRVAVFGIGGVGGTVCESLVRCGIGGLDVFDNDIVSLSNINRQIFADHSTVGMKKVDAAEKRLKLISPECEIKKYDLFFMPDNSDQLDFSVYDYIVDAVDTVTAKIEIIRKAKEQSIPIISSMGTGNKLDPTMFEISDIFKTSVCPLAKVMRHELKKRNIKSLKVLYSKELPHPTNVFSSNGKAIPGSVSFVPTVAGYIIGGEVIKDLLRRETI